MMRRGSMNIGIGGGEPLIVVEESGAEEGDSWSPGTGPSVTRDYSLEEGAGLDPYLLSPWRDTRKHSLPTPSCTTGPTASQVRRLSERGESAAKEAREAAFLATLTQGAPQTGGRRHSVVTISRVPQSLFGRGRRESIAAFGSRRDSLSKKCPPATDTFGSSHNLQLDIMDDILQARKVRMRMWNTSSERVCEVQPLDESASAEGSTSSSVRYTNRGRRHSDFVGNPLPPIPARRRASEMRPLPPVPPRTTASKGGVICSNTDLRYMLNTLTSSATEIDRCGRPDTRRRLADTRSSSFDAATLRIPSNDAGTTWFKKRHQTLAAKNDIGNKQNKVTFAPDSKAGLSDVVKVVWDSGAIVDASALGSAIEVFLRKSGATETPPAAVPSTTKDTYQIVSEAVPSTSKQVAHGGEGRWSPSRAQEDTTRGCDTSLCDTIKDLFI